MAREGLLQHRRNAVHVLFVKATNDISPTTILAGRKRSDSTRDKSNTLNVAILGFGTVGSSVARILTEHSSGLRITHILNRDVKRKRVDWVSPEVKWTENIDDVLSSDADVIVELIGGLKPAGEWMRLALQSGKSVVTANKQVIARYASELIRLAHDHGQHIAFGASVAGGVPVIAALQEGLAGDELVELCGILNGTCNYILTRIENGVSFDEALREAQKLGFAEANPAEDVDGLDARAKLTILARTGLHVAVDHSAIGARSISMLAPIDFEYANLLGCTIRQISRAEKTADKLLASVEPMLVHRSSPLAGVEGPQNLVMSTGKFGGETVFAGHGAGGNATAVAVVSDLISILRARQTNGGALYENGIPELPVSADFTTRHYLRFVVRDEPGIIASIARILCAAGINIDSVFQKPGFPKSKLPFVITLEPCSAAIVRQSLRDIAKLDFLVEPCVDLPILD
jgi:homoserine dehydrogenase